MGVVYAARQASIDRTVAIKMLKEKAADEHQRRKFLSEAVITGDLDHPNIVPIYDLGTNQEGALFYSMKRVQGTPWDERIRQLSLTENLEILMKVADAVAFAHSRGVIHRDLKPENTMLGEFGEVLVMDWGLALPTSRFPQEPQRHAAGQHGRHAGLHGAGNGPGADRADRFAQRHLPVGRDAVRDRHRPAAAHGQGCHDLPGFGIEEQGRADRQEGRTGGHRASSDGLRIPPTATPRSAISRTPSAAICPTPKASPWPPELKTSWPPPARPTTIKTLLRPCLGFRKPCSCGT